MHDPSLILLRFAAATSNMSVLFLESGSIRQTFGHLLECYQGVYGLIDCEETAIIFWLRGEKIFKQLPTAAMSLDEIEEYLQRNIKRSL